MEKTMKKLLIVTFSIASVLSVPVLASTQTSNNINDALKDKRTGVYQVFEGGKYFIENSTSAGASQAKSGPVTASICTFCGYNFK